MVTVPPARVLIWIKRTRNSVGPRLCGEQRSRIAHVGRIAALFEPPVDRLEDLAERLPSARFIENTAKTDRASQLEEPRPLLSGNEDRLAQPALGLRGAPFAREAFALQPQQLGQVKALPRLFADRQGFPDSFERLIEPACCDQSFREEREAERLIGGGLHSAVRVHAGSDLLEPLFDFPTAH